MQLFKTPNIQFLKYKYIALALTGLVILAGVLNMTVFKGLKLGVDFGEGTLLRIMMRTPTDEGEIRDLLGRVGLAKSQVQKSGESGREFQIRAMESVDLQASEEQAARPARGGGHGRRDGFARRYLARRGRVRLDRPLLTVGYRP